MLYHTMIAFLLQSAAEPSGIPWAAIGAGGGSTTISGILLYILRQQGLERAAERKASEDERALERKASEDRYAALSLGMRQAYQEATAAITKLTVMLEQDQRHARAD